MAIIGASGYTGAELVRLLATHSRANVVAATASGERAGSKLSDLFPHLRGIGDIVLEEYNPDTIAEKADFAFIALGHGKALEIAPQLLERGLKVCDLGADFRLRDPEIYQEWYKLEHTAIEVLEEAVYGLPEWNREQIKSARMIANPGCYPTSAILALSPFFAADVLDPASIIINSASGTSGAGRSSFGLAMHFPELHDDYKAYNVGAHRHTPEIEQGLLFARGRQSEPLLITFTAHLLPIARGILSTCYANLVDELDTAQAHAILSERYANEPFVRVRPAGEVPNLKHVIGSNFCDIGVVVDERHSGRLIVVAAEDNLVKGASGQAIQNMNLMCGFPETDGLQVAPSFP